MPFISMWENTARLPSGCSIDLSDFHIFCYYIAEQHYPPRWPVYLSVHWRSKIAWVDHTLHIDTHVRLLVALGKCAGYILSWLRHNHKIVPILTVCRLLSGPARVQCLQEPMCWFAGESRHPCNSPIYQLLRDKSP